MASKKSSVKWEIPEIKGSTTPRKATQTQKDTISERLYSDTFEDSTNIYSDTFVTESYSDTFVSSSSERGNRSQNEPFKFGRGQISSDHSETDQIQTVITEGIQTVIEVDSEEFPGTAIDTELHDTGAETMKDISETHPTDSYTDTFESADRTKTEFDLRTESGADSQRSYSATFTQSSKTFAETGLSETADLDRSFIAPDYDGKSLIHDDYDTDVEDYSDTFEPTELTTQTSYIDTVPVEETFNRHEKQAHQRFIDRLMGKLKDKQLIKDRGLQVISPELSEDSEDEYLRHYCKKKVKQLKKRRGQSMTDSSIISEQKDAITSTPLSGDMLSDYGLDDSVLERAKLTKVLSQMKRAAKRQIHEVKNCPQCSELKERLESEEAEKVFTDSRAKMLKSKMMDLHVENHILKMNSISMIAELARHLPRSSEKPEKIMDQLLEPLLGKNVMR